MNQTSRFAHSANSGGSHHRDRAQVGFVSAFTRENTPARASTYSVIDRNRNETAIGCNKSRGLIASAAIVKQTMMNQRFDSFQPMRLKRMIASVKRIALPSTSPKPPTR